MAALDVTVSTLPDRVIVHLDGEGDIDGAPALEQVLTKLSALRPKLVILDAAKLTFISSLAMGQLMAFQRAIARSKGRVIIAAAQPLVKEALHRAHLQTVFAFQESAAVGGNSNDEIRMTNQ
jgi:anti-anti-sigma factor